MGCPAWQQVDECGTVIFELPDTLPSWGEMTLVVFTITGIFLNSNCDFQEGWLGWHSHVQDLDLMTSLSQAAVTILHFPT